MPKSLGKRAYLVFSYRNLKKPYPYQTLGDAIYEADIGMISFIVTPPPIKNQRLPIIPLLTFTEHHSYVIIYFQPNNYNSMSRCSLHITNI